MSKPNELDLRFVEYLEGLVRNEDRAALAALRRGLGKEPGAAPEMHRHVVPRQPKDRLGQDLYYLIAALFATHQGSWKAQGTSDHGRSFGASMARLKEATKSESIERRFVALLNSHRDDLPAHLRHAVSLLKSKEIPIDWPLLLYDLRSWDHPDRFVQRTWAGDFWSGSEEAGEKEADPTSMKETV